MDAQYGGRGAFSKIVSSELICNVIPTVSTYTTQVAGAPPDAPDAGPEVVASTVSYLVKPEAYFITGGLFLFELVDGGADLGIRSIYLYERRYSFRLTSI